MSRPSKALVSRACQTELYSPDPSGDKAFFRIVFEGQTLQFKLPMGAALSIMFSRVPVKGDFIWHSIVLDGSLSPSHYNMLPGEEHCATIHVAANYRRSMTFAEEAMVNDAVRAISFRLRLKEEENDSLKQEIDDLHAQIYALHRELSNVSEMAARKLEEERVRRDMIVEERFQLESNLKRIEAERDMLRRQSATRRLDARLFATPPSASSAAERDELLTPGVITASPAAASMEKLKTELRLWEEHVKAPQNPLSSAPPARAEVNDDGSGETISVSCVCMNESAQQETTLGPLRITRPFTISHYLKQVAISHPQAVPPIDRCMVCIKSAATGEYSVLDIQHQAQLATPLHDDDVVYLANMSA
jgi:hypothetical protein